MFKYKIIKNVLKKNVCKKIINKIDLSIKEQALELDKKNRAVYLNELLNPFLYDRYFFNLFKIKKINNICKKLIGKNYYLNAFAALKKIPVTGKLRSDKFHIDGKFELKSFNQPIQLNVLFSLTKSNKFHGTTVIKLNKKNKYINLNPGDCMIFNSFLSHKGTLNLSNVSRYIIGYNLIPHFIKPRFDFISMTKNFKLDQDLKNFLGYNFVPPKSLKEYLSQKTYLL